MQESDYKMEELEPEHFEWLDLAEEFFKHDGRFEYGEERNSSVFRGENVYDDIESEWRKLNELYEGCPEHVVEPLQPVKVEEGGEEKVVGFYMERFEGENLQDFLLNSDDIRRNRRIISEVEAVKKSLHRQGVVHGDLANNIIYDGDTFKLHDPVGEPEDEDYGVFVQYDDGDIEVLRERSDPFGESIDL
jgi:serine/threonine protein kinase